VYFKHVSFDYFWAPQNLTVRMCSGWLGGGGAAPTRQSVNSLTLHNGKHKSTRHSTNVVNPNDTKTMIEHKYLATIAAVASACFDCWESNERLATVGDFDSDF